MNRDFYFFGNFFLGLAIVSGLFQSIIHFQLDAQIFALSSFVDWFLVVNITTLAGSALILKYYHRKKYWATFYTGLFAVLAMLFHFIVIYSILVTRHLENYYITTLLLALATGMLYAVSLIFSHAGKRLWLKSAGIFLFLICFIQLSTFIWHMNSQDVLLKATLENINQWTSLAGSIVPLMLMMNFGRELKLLKEINEQIPLHRSFESLFIMVVLLAVGFTLAFGLRIAHESYGRIIGGLATYI